MVKDIEALFGELDDGRETMTVEVKVIGKRGDDFYYMVNDSLRGIHRYLGSDYKTFRYSGANTNINVDSLSHQSNDTVEVMFVERYKGAGRSRMDLTTESLEAIANAKYHMHSSIWKVEEGVFDNYGWGDFEVLLRHNHSIKEGNYTIEYKNEEDFYILFEHEGKTYRTTLYPFGGGDLETSLERVTFDPSKDIHN